MKRKWLNRILLCSVVIVGLSGMASAQLTHVLNDFESGAEGWNGTSGVITNIAASGGNLTWDDSGAAGAIGDSWNNTGAAFLDGAGRIDITGMSTIEFVDVVYTGADATIDVQMYGQVGTSSTYYYSGSDITFASGVAQTIGMDLSGVSATDIVSVRRYGLSIRSHSNPASWSMSEVRTTGTPLTNRVFAAFNSTSPDNGLCGAVVNFDSAAVPGGVYVNPSAGVDGALEWVDIPGGGGGAITIYNGYGNGYNYRPCDLTSYDTMAWTVIVSASPSNPSATVGMQLFTQVLAAYTWNTLGGSNFTVYADGNPVQLDGDMSSAVSPEYTQTIGVNLAEHTDTLIIQVDEIRAYDSSAIKDWAQY